jgi:uncharacterized metal-binding protein YceD (DUF177 family)
VDKAFESKYAIEIPKLRPGVNMDEFHVDSAFFQEFEYSLIQEGEVDIQAEITKSETHLDANFHFTGHINLECDRCLEIYPHQIDFQIRIIFAYDESLEFDTDEVLLIEREDPVIYLANDFYDFISLQIPLRKVPEPEVHVCPPEVLAYLDGSYEGEWEDDSAEEEGEIDPRWEALKKFKDSENTK